MDPDEKEKKKKIRCTWLVSVSEYKGGTVSPWLMSGLSLKNFCVSEYYRYICSIENEAWPVFLETFCEVFSPS